MFNTAFAQSPRPICIMLSSIHLISCTFSSFGIDSGLTYVWTDRAYIPNFPSAASSNIPKWHVVMNRTTKYEIQAQSLVARLLRDNVLGGIMYKLDQTAVLDTVQIFCDSRLKLSGY